MAAMSLFQHWVADVSMRHQAAIRAARGLPPVTSQTGRTPGEGEVSRLSVALFQRLHTLADVVAKHGPEKVFGVPAEPIPPHEVRRLLELPPAP